MGETVGGGTVGTIVEVGEPDDAVGFVVVGVAGWYPASICV